MGFARSSFVYLLALVCTCRSTNMIKHLAVHEGERLKLQGLHRSPKSDGTVYRETWSQVRTTCNNINEVYFSLGARVHKDVLFGADCDVQSHEERFIASTNFIMKNGALKQVQTTMVSYPEPDVLVTETENLVILHNATKLDGGIYMLSAKNESGDASVTTFIVNVLPMDTFVREPTMGPPTIITPPISVPHMTVTSVGSTLFYVGDTVRTSVSLRGNNFPYPYRLTFKWFFVQHQTGCYAIKIHEPCIFHPSEPECLGSKDTECIVASTLNTRLIATRTVSNCSQPWQTCRYEEAVDASMADRLMWLNETDPNFQILQVQKENSGLYILAVEYNGRVIAWGRQSLSTINDYVGVLEDSHKPDLLPPVPQNPSRTPTGEKPSGRSRTPPKLVVGVCITVSTALSLIVMLIVVIRMCVRRKRSQRVVTNAYGFYTSLPTTDPYADVGSDREDIGSGCKTEDIEQTRRARRTSFSVGFVEEQRSRRSSGPDYSNVINRVGGFDD